MSRSTFTPRETVGELDRYIIGQQAAKRAVAVALRNRWRRQQVPGDLRDEISPKNIILVGPTGCGKTEIARRLAKLAAAPFVKVEASKFTEVGYVGRDVESMVRDLVENAIQICQAEERESVANRAREQAEERIIRMLWAIDHPPPPPPPPPPQSNTTLKPNMLGPFMMGPPPPPPPQGPEPTEAELGEMRRMLREGQYDERKVPLDVEQSSGNPFMTIFGGGGGEEMEINLQDMLGQLPGFKAPPAPKKRRELLVPEAFALILKEETDKLIDHDKIKRDALRRTEQDGIIFLDEIDKVGARQGHQGADVSREGVQRDLLPIVEGSTVSTKHGPVKTDHVLFIAAGAFHVSKVSDLIPELQGRFPIRVELKPLTKSDFVQILKEPRNALTRQYEALMLTEGVTLTFTDDAVEAIASYAEKANEKAENIGARRLHTILEALLEDLSFSASERGESTFVVDAAYVNATLEPVMAHQDVARYIL
ncbi:MAG: ATP-dependent protease ATPase subunit HslU [Myxococcales bacterium]|nr:ATP-dependent protease ATPase subunit HslU [Myxococcales bacterium]MCB9628123.1 ATP-dependent protease ATPase subunit HslU [Sandaracinaceae bacterium]